jgi:uncharacterized protein YjdB
LGVLRIHLPALVGAALAGALALGCSTAVTPPPTSKMDAPVEAGSEAGPDRPADTTDGGTPEAGGDTAPDGGGGDATPDAAVPPVAQMVTSAGGTVTNLAGVVLDIPAGALAQPTMITIAPSATAPTGAAGPAFVFGPEGQQFAMPVALTLPFDPKNVPVGQVPAVFTAPAGSSNFQDLGGVVSDATHMQVGITHFSVFAVARKQPKLTGLQVSPADAQIALDSFAYFKATASYENNTTADVTAQVTWTSSNPAVATIAGDGLAIGQMPGTTLITAKLNGETGFTTLTVTSATLTGIHVTPTMPSIANGTTAQLTATGTYSDGSTQDVTDQVTWTSSMTAIATVSNGTGSHGRVSGLSPGTSVITAAIDDLNGTTTVTVTPATLVSLVISPPTATLNRGATQLYEAFAVYSDGATQDVTADVTWSSSNLNVVTVSNASGSVGLVSAVGVGQATVGASLNNVVATATVTVTAPPLVSVAITPALPIIATGTTQPLTATALFGDGSTIDVTSQVVWVSSNTAAATVANASGSAGIATGVAPGQSTVTATIGGVTGTTTLTVSAAVLVSIAVTPANPSIAKGTTQLLVATGVYSDNTTQDLTLQATWSSSNTTIATVSNASGSIGRATAVAIGWANIIATFSGKSGSTKLTVNTATLSSIAVTPTPVTVPNGTQVTFSVTGFYTDGSSQDHTADATFMTSDADVATVSNSAGSRGVATAAMAGSATITATYNGKAADAALTVSAAALVSLEVTPTHPSIAKGTTKDFVATGLYTDGTHQDITTQVTWSSSNTGVAPVSNAAGSNGRADGLAVGIATITATISGKSANTTLTVTAATLASIAVTPANPTVAKGTNTPLTAIGTYSDASTQDITATATWTSADTTAAAVSNAAGTKGLASGLELGSSIITASIGAVSGTTTLTVSAATLTSITVTPPNATAAAGLSVNFTATGTYSDGTFQPITDQVTWNSSAPGVATVSNAAGQEGKATGVVLGITVITATTGGISGSTTLTISSATLVSIAVTPATPSTTVAHDVALTATGTYSDGTTMNLTSEVTWSSTDTGVATVSNASGTRGTATGVSVGTSTVSATLGGVSGSQLLTVN